MSRQIFFLREYDKKGYTAKDTDKKGDSDFVGEFFDVHVVVGTTPTVQQDVCASTVHYNSYVLHSPISPTPNGLWYKGTSTLLSEKLNAMVPRTYQ